MDIPAYEQLLRLLLAAVLGAFIGFERERLARPAGLRTHSLVCMGSALLMVVSTYGFKEVIGEQGSAPDPSRIAAQVVSGIGFIGAGTIIAHGTNIRGLTTAASLWTAAAIGLAAGGGMYLIAVAGTVLALLILEPLKYVENMIHRSRQRPDPSKVSELAQPPRRTGRYKRRRQTLS